MLFVCVENACRSLMAEAFFNHAAPPGWRAVSAGTRPTRSAEPRTARLLAEVGIAAPEHPPQILTPEMLSAAEIVVTMGCLDDEACPARLRHLRPRDWGLPDPARLDDDGFRSVRDTIRERVGALRRELSSG
ncbi:MAG: arsenate reductase ArsC [Thermoplasmata archaeon]